MIRSGPIFALSEPDHVIGRFHSWLETAKLKLKIEKLLEMTLRVWISCYELFPL